MRSIITIESSNQNLDQKRHVEYSSNFTRPLVAVVLSSPIKQELELGIKD
jgi:hypothetical protein